MSNTWNLWANNGWRATLIEGDRCKYEELRDKTQSFTQVTPYHAHVTPQGENCLDIILSKAGLPSCIDLLSIDIDGDDYHLFMHLNHHVPRVIVIEHNPTIPAGIELVQRQGEYVGASATSLVNLAHEKGYKLAHMTQCNVFLVRDDEFPKLGFDEPAVEDVFDTSQLVHVVTSYDGTAWLTQPLTYKPRLSSLPNEKFSTGKLFKMFVKSLFGKQVSVIAEDSHPNFETCEKLFPVKILR